MLHIQHLTKSYSRTVEANHDITLSFVPGQVVGLLGHNGAGKSTLLGQLVGAIRPTSGTVRFGESDLIADPHLARRVCSMMGQSAAPMRGVTPRGAVTSMARLRGRSKSAAAAITDNLLTTLELGPWANTAGERLSGGVRRLTAYAMACAGAGPIILLDEPTNDVDPMRRPILWDHMAGLAKHGHLVMVVTHNLAEAQSRLDRAVVMRAGRVVGDYPREKLLDTPEATLRLTLFGAVRGLQTPFCSATAEPREEGSLLVAFSPSDAAQAINWAIRCRDQGLVTDFSISPSTLEDLYVALHEN